MQVGTKASDIATVTSLVLTGPGYESSAHSREDTNLWVWVPDAK